MLCVHKAAQSGAAVTFPLTIMCTMALITRNAKGTAESSAETGKMRLRLKQEQGTLWINDMPRDKVAGWLKVEDGLHENKKCVAIETLNGSQCIIRFDSTQAKVNFEADLRRLMERLVLTATHEHQDLNKAEGMVGPSSTDIQGAAPSGMNVGYAHDTTAADSKPKAQRFCIGKQGAPSTNEQSGKPPRRSESCAKRLGHTPGEREAVNSNCVIKKSKMGMQDDVGLNNTLSVRGLKNVGNTCYMNAVMQGISVMTELLDDLEVIREEEGSLAPNSLAHNLLNTLQIINGNRKAPPGASSAEAVRKAIGAVCHKFASNEQQDAHEFLVQMIMMLHKEIKELKTRNPRIDTVPSQPAKRCEADSSVIRDHLSTSIQKKITCVSCGNTKLVEERIWDTAICLTENSGPNTMESALEHYRANEAVAAACAHCENQQAVIRQTTTKSPHTVIVHVKRFATRAGTNGYIKLDNNVSAPQWLSVVQATGDLAPSSMNDRYELRAMIVHLGCGPEVGHYICYRKMTNGGWALCDDETVTPLKELPVESISRNMYLAIYTRNTVMG